MVKLHFSTGLGDRKKDEEIIINGDRRPKSKSPEGDTFWTGCWLSEATSCY